MKKVFSLIGFLLFTTLSFSQPNQQPDAAQLKLKIKKLNVLGSVLYMAAHPDDENTRLISSLANERLASVAYLSLTRGDGGQNLIGPEIRDLLGLIRTQELLAARRIDGGQQFFTRANDFGFSKSADEAFQIWGKNEILSDAVKVLRQYQPDIIITRFPPDERAGHGHHTASAILAGEAFDVAASPTSFPEQVATLGTWQVKRLYTNTGRWWNKDINEKTPGVITVDVGGYSTLLGKSYSEISALSSSQHKSQGWGSRGVRGYQAEFLEHMKGEVAQKDIFEGVNITWTRLKGGEKVRPLVERAIQEFNPENPAAIVPLLFQIRTAIGGLENSVWKRRKYQETEQLIQECLGLFIEATAGHYQSSPGEKIRINLEIINRSGAEVQVNEISAKGVTWDTTFTQVLRPNVALQLKTYASVDPHRAYSDPYWLTEPHSLGLFTVKNPDYIGLPQNPPAAEFVFSVQVGQEKMQITRPLIYKWVDNVKGEWWRPFEIVPPVFVNLQDKVIIFNNGQPREVKIVVRGAGDRLLKGELKLSLPAGWKCEPASIPIELMKKNEELTKSFQLYPSATEATTTIKAFVETEGKVYDQSIQLINYDHIPIQTLLPKAEVKAVRLDLKKEGNLVAYIKGAGDEIPSALRNIGYEVWEMKNEEVTLQNLKRADAVVLGVRALNANERIRYIMPSLLEYVKTGGTLVVQYNTNFDMETDAFSPYPLKLSRERVTQEDAEVRILKPDHALLNAPNKITPRDFEGWVQERGLYYPSTWDPNFEALLSMNDKGETPKDGSLLVAKYGEGHYIYTGLSFFRELPEGVAGAYKLFANAISLGRSKKTDNAKTKNKTK